MPSVTPSLRFQRNGGVCLQQQRGKRGAPGSGTPPDDSAQAAEGASPPKRAKSGNSARAAARSSNPARPSSTRPQTTSTRRAPRPATTPAATPKGRSAAGRRGAGGAAAKTRTPPERRTPRRYAAAACVQLAARTSPACICTLLLWRHCCYTVICVAVRSRCCSAQCTPPRPVAAFARIEPCVCLHLWHSCIATMHMAVVLMAATWTLARSGTAATDRHAGASSAWFRTTFHIAHYTLPSMHAGCVRGGDAPIATATVVGRRDEGRTVQGGGSGLVRGGACLGVRRGLRRFRRRWHKGGQ